MGSRFKSDGAKSYIAATCAERTVNERFKGVKQSRGYIVTNKIERDDKNPTEQNGGGPSSQGAGNSSGQQGSPDGGKEGKSGSQVGSVDSTSMDDAGNSRDANQPDNKTAKRNKAGG